MLLIILLVLSTNLLKVLAYNGSHATNKVRSASNLHEESIQRLLPEIPFIYIWQLLHVDSKPCRKTMYEYCQNHVLITMTGRVQFHSFCFSNEMHIFQTHVLVHQNDVNYKSCVWGKIAFLSKQGSDCGKVVHL